MNTHRSLMLGSIFCAAVAIAATSAYAEPLYPGNHHVRNNQMNATTNRTGSWQGLRGANGTFNQSVTRAPGSTTGSTSWTNAQGGTGSHTFANTWNKSTGLGTQSSSTTYANGKTSSSQGDWTKTGTGTADYTGTHTGVNGQVIDVSKAVSDTNGVKTVDSTYTNPTTGKSSTVDSTLSGGQINTTAIGPNGKTATSDQTYAKTSNGYSQTGTVTGPNGKTSTDTRNVGYTQDANGETTRTATGSVTTPNGTTTPWGNTETYTKTVTPNPAPTTPSQPPVD